MASQQQSRSRLLRTAPKEGAGNGAGRLPTNREMSGFLKAVQPIGNLGRDPDVALSL
jgi:hypothetical protein